MNDKTGRAAVTVPDKPNAIVRERPALPAARYVAGEEIARGGMGRVALATDTLLERVVAVKQALTLDPEMLRRFTRETKITARLEHPSIVPVYDAGTDGDAPFYVMRRVSGRPLSELILSTAFDARLALVPNLLAAAQAVAHAHSRGIVHRDIKPANILVGTLGETVVIDWGLAKVVDEPDDDDPIEQAAGDSLHTRVGTVFGTPGFMSPKQLRGESVGYAADVYALGASLYFLLSGKPPHHAPTGEAMMMLAAKGPPTPLADLVPGVPRELAAIVDTALAYGDRHYDDASAFAEDLRRFSTGQLVAAHHYSSRERLVRFLRRHRAAVSIGVIAMAVIAVGATLSFQRVIEERDRADAEAAEAVAAREQERERADQLTLIRARMLVDTNPTEAIALLKDIAPTSRRLSEAHGLASAAIMRGVPWGMPPPSATTAVLEISPDGERMLQTTIAGELYVWDLTKRTQVLKRDFGLGFGVRGTWLGTKILLHGRVLPALLNPETGTMRPVDLPKLHQVISSGDQTLNVGLIDGSPDVVVFDRDGKVTGRPWPGHQVKGAAVTGNGAYVALVSDRELIVRSRDGKEVATRVGKLGLVYASNTNRIAIRDDLDIWELELEPTPKWTKLETSVFHKYVMSVAYRGDELLVTMGSGHILALREGRLLELERVSGTTAFLAEAGQDDFLYALGQTELLYLHAWGHRRIALPQVMLSPRIAARRGVDRFVVASDEVMLIYELTNLRPRKVPLPAQAHAEFYDETTLIVSDDRSSWFDLDTGKAIAIEPRMPGAARAIAISPDAGKVVHVVWNGDSTQLYEVRARAAEARAIYDGPPLGAVAILDDGTVVYTRGRTLSVVGTPDRALVALAAPIASVVSRRSDFVVVSTEGELVRGNAAGVVQRIQLPRPDELLAPTGGAVSPHLDVSQTGDILVGWGGSVWMWADRLESVVTVGAPISGLRAIGDGVLVLMPNRRGVMANLATRQLHELPVLANEVVSSSWKRGALGFAVNRDYHFVELTTFTTWPSTARHWSINPAILSESGRSLITHTQDEFLRWTIPLGTGPIRPRLEPATNATMNRAGLLTWPWLQP